MKASSRDRNPIGPEILIRVWLKEGEVLVSGMQEEKKNKTKQGDRGNPKFVQGNSLMKEVNLYICLLLFPNPSFHRLGI